MGPETRQSVVCNLVRFDLVGLPPPEGCGATHRPLVTHMGHRVLGGLDPDTDAGQQCESLVAAQMPIKSTTAPFSMGVASARP